MIIIGIDPGLTCTGWGVIAKAGSRLSHVANGQIRTDTTLSMAERLVELDAVLTDVKMPGISGLELLDRIRQTDRTKDVPVVLFTGVDDHGLKTSC